jgi:vancomycin resistance protein VanJ
VTTIPVRCGCGQTINADSSHLGRKVRCRCGRVLEVQRPSRLVGAQSGARGSLSWRLRSGLRSALRAVLPTGLPALTRFRALPAARALDRWIARLSWGSLALALLAWLVLWGLGDRWWPATVLLFGPRWLLLLPLAALLPAVVALRRPRLLAPLLVAAAVVLVPVMGLRFGWRNWLGTPPAAPRLTIVSFNVEGGQGIPLGGLLDEEEPDVVALQECGPELQEALGTLGAAWNVHTTRGLCLLSRFPIGQADSLPGYQLGAIGGSGNAMRYTLATPSGPITVVNQHLETPRKGLEPLRALQGSSTLVSNMELRDVASSRTSNWIAAMKGPVIVAGDFNTPVESAIYQRHWSRFENAFGRAGRGFGMTRKAWKFGVRIDHVLTAGGWHAERAVVGPDLGSDHRPLVVRLWRAGA